MKLSEAIRAGAKIRPQGFGELYGSRGTTCALGAAMDGSGMYGRINVYKHFPVCTTEAFAMPCDCASPGVVPHEAVRVKILAEGVAHLNDKHRWSREAIAEWVETVEKKLETEQAGSSSVVGRTPAEVESPACVVGSEVHCTPAEVTATT